MGGPDLKQYWSKFEEYLKNNYPIILKALNDSATEDEIAYAEKIMGLNFPKSFKELLRIHNGQSDEFTGVIGNYYLLSLKEIIETWETMKELLENNEFEDFEEVNPVGPVKKEFWWNPYWIPFVTNGSGDNICIDLDPDKEGTIGQIITFWHDWEKRKVISNSLEEWFREIIQCLEDGTYSLIEEDGEIVFNVYGFMRE